MVKVGDPHWGRWGGVGFEYGVYQQRLWGETGRQRRKSIAIEMPDSDPDDPQASHKLAQ